MQSASIWRALLTPVVIVSALGYFVDAFDLILFSAVRVKSLKDIGLSGEALTSAGLYLINMQMAGMLLGGVIWGIIGDKKGRVKVLLGSILLYSVANIANAFVEGVETYALWRFLAGIGLAGEIGAGITLVSESLAKEKRGLGTTIVATIGIAGAATGALVGDLLPWRTAYIIGGVMGLALLVMRAMLYESHLFEKMDARNIARGKFYALFTKWRLFRQYLCCILMGVPIWYLVGILATLSPELLLGMNGPSAISAGKAIATAYIGMTAGDLFAGLLSQYLKSRRKAVFIMLAGAVIAIAAFFLYCPVSPDVVYVWYGVMGFFMGYWVLMLTMAAELFGTNMRATAASTVPNFVRGSLILLNLAVLGLKGQGMNIITASQIIGIAVMGAAVTAVCLIPETFHRDMDFEEKI